MGDAAREGADALHALGAEELGFQLFLFGNVGIDDQLAPGGTGIRALARWLSTNCCCNVALSRWSSAKPSAFSRAAPASTAMKSASRSSFSPNNPETLRWVT